MDSNIGQQINLILMIVVFGGVIWFMNIRPQLRRQRELRELRAALRRGDRVTTTGGLIGEVARVDDRTVILKLQGEARCEILRESVVEVLARQDSSNAGQGAS